MKLLGSCKITPKLRIYIVKEAAKLLGVHDGDHVLFYENEDGDIVIKKG